jgi:hypothetical protein
MSAIFVTNTNSTNVLANGIIPINPSRRMGNDIISENGNLILKRPGYYKVSGTITFTAQTAGNVTISLQKNNTNVPGITATETITTAETEVRTIPIQGLVRVLCHEGTPIITLINESDIDITTLNVSLTIIY